MSSPQIGHNLPPDIFDGTESLPSNLQKMSWFPLDIQALRKVLIDKPLDQRGFYITVLLALYEHMEALPEDDRKACMRLGGMDLRIYRRMRDLFVKNGILIQRPSGRISNARFEEEITKYVSEFRNRQAGRAKRDETIRRRQSEPETADRGVDKVNGCINNEHDLSRTYGVANPIAKQDVQDSCPEHPSYTNDHLFKKHNEINEVSPEFSLTEPLSEPLKVGGQLESKKEDSKKDPLKPPKGGDDPIAEKFEEWWRAFPRSVRKVGKGECMALFRQAITGSRRSNGRGQKVIEHGPATADQLIAAAKAYAATNPDPQFVPAPATWLNQGRWLDEHETIPAAQVKDKPEPAPYWWRGREEMVRKFSIDVWKGAIERYANGVWREPILGPAPGAPDCLVSSEVITQLRLSELWGPDGIRRK